jgi:hypothetical protein
MSIWNTRIKKIVDLPYNKKCADCGGFSHWASINIGCFICMRCAGIHRSIGVHITKIRSLTLDTWNREQYDFMKKMGNIEVNMVYESTLPDNLKPKPNCPDVQLNKFIQDKYIYKHFYREKPKPVPKPQPIIEKTEPTSEPIPEPIPEPTPEIKDLIDFSFDEPEKKEKSKTETENLMDLLYNQNQVTNSQHFDFMN